MNTRTWVLFLVITCTLFLGCSYKTVVVNGHKLLESEWKQTESHIRSQASFSLDCPGESLKVTPLDVQGFAYAKRIGVEGCEKRLLYVRMPDGSYVANTALRPEN